MGVSRCDTGRSASVIGDCDNWGRVPPVYSTHMDKSCRNQTEIPARRFLTTREAARYCGYRSTSSIYKAFHVGWLCPAGRRGGKGTFVWAITHLDRFMLGKAWEDV